MPDSYDKKPRIDKPAYGIVGCEKLYELPHLVNIEIADGYEPQGAPFFEPMRMTWCQAMFKRAVVTVSNLRLSHKAG